MMMKTIGTTPRMTLMPIDKESGIIFCNQCEKDWTWDLADKDGNMSFVECDDYNAENKDVACDDGQHLCNLDCWIEHIINRHGMDRTFKNINIKTGVVSEIKVDSG